MRWICSACNVPTQEVSDVQLIYNDLDLPPGVGYRCPACGLEFLDGEYVINELNPAETMLEGK